MGIFAIVYPKGALLVHTCIDKGYTGVVQESLKDDLRYVVSGYF